MKLGPHYTVYVQLCCRPSRDWLGRYRETDWQADFVDAHCSQEIFTISCISVRIPSAWASLSHTVSGSQPRGKPGRTLHVRTTHWTENADFPTKGLTVSIYICEDACKHKMSLKGYWSTLTLKSLMTILRRRFARNHIERVFCEWEKKRKER